MLPTGASAWRNALAYPGGVASLNQNHPLYGPQLFCAGVCLGNNSIFDLTQNTLYTPPGTAGSKITAAGPGVYTTANTTYFNINITKTLPSQTTYTFAAIFTVASASSDHIPISVWGSGIAELELEVFAAGFYVKIGNTIQSFSPAAPAAIVGHSYFFACTLNPTRWGLIRDLTNGAVWFGQTAASVNNFVPTSVQVAASNNNSPTAAVMATGGGVPIGTLLQWSAAPFDFWYAPTLRNMLVTPGVKQGPNSLSLATTEARDKVAVAIVNGQLASLATTEARDTVAVNATNIQLGIALATTEARDKVAVQIPSPTNVPSFVIDRVRRLRNPLTFPGGPAQLNRNHIAARGAAMAAVATGGNFYDLVTARKFVPGGAPHNIITAGGPGTTSSNAPAPNLLALNGTQTYNNWTLAVICTCIPPNTSGETLITLDGNGYYNIYCAQFQFGIANGGSIWTQFFFPYPPNGVVGHVYFFAWNNISTGGPFGIGLQSYVIRDLLTGQVWTGTYGQGVSFVNANYSYALCGVIPDSEGTIPIHAAYVGTPGLTQEQCLQWANAPWDLWYPPTLADMLLSSSRSVATVGSGTSAALMIGV